MPFITNKVIDFALGEKFKYEKESSYNSKSEVIEKFKNNSKIPFNIFWKFNGISIESMLYIKDFVIEPEVMYSNKKDIIETVKKEDIPALYILNSKNNRFLDDILLFTKIKESYIAKDIECRKENIKEIFFKKDTSKGIYIFINDGQESEKIVNEIKNILNLQKITYLKRLNACDIYYIK